MPQSKAIDPLVNSSVDSDIFYAWLTQDLLPQFLRNALIVMDNAAFHKRQAIQQALRAAIHLNICLPIALT